MSRSVLASYSSSIVNIKSIISRKVKCACVFTDRRRLDELTYGIPLDGPHQTNPPSIEDIISSIRIDREGQVCRIRHKEEIDVLEYQILTREIMSTLKPLEEIIWENVFCLGERKIQRDRGTRRGRPSTSSSTFDQPSSSHLNDDDDGGKTILEETYHRWLSRISKLSLWTTKFGVESGS
ncbi:hypothetical protein Tco_0352615 [Tanacetum coccineum]